MERAVSTRVIRIYSETEGSSTGIYALLTELEGLAV